MPVTARRRLPSLLACALAAACGPGSTGGLPAGDAPFRLESVSPSTVLPGTRLVVLGEGFQGGAAQLTLQGTVSRDDGSSGRVDWTATPSVQSETELWLAITEDLLAAHLATAGQPDPELIIRTAGDVRLSNFLLWQGAYSELHFCASFWPAFSRGDLLAAIDDYTRRQRKFGGLVDEEA